MELSSPESIRTLMKSFADPSKAVPPRHRSFDGARSPIKDRRRRCRCGRCHQCLDNARWERIFTEKFADPDYYTRIVPHMASPLTSI